MKFIFAAIFLVTLVPAHAEEPQSAFEEMGQIIQCNAIDRTLAHMHMQIAASLIALSGPSGQQALKPMVNSYLAMARDEAAKADNLAQVADEAVIPSLLAQGMKQDDIKEAVSKMLAKTLPDMALAIGNPGRSFTDQVEVEKALKAQSDACDAYAASVKQRHTI